MAEKRARGVLVTVFGVVGTACFALLALEYVVARYDGLGALVVLPAPMGLGDFLTALPDWSSFAVTLGIWLGLLGAVLLLLGDRASVLVLALSFLASLVAFAWAVLALVQGDLQAMTISPLEYIASLLLGSFGLWLYARTAKRYGRI